jgi:3-methylcrotonyl-CoA carboxylase alpha subunit
VGFESGDTITPFYDPMIAKIIVWDENRPRAIQKIVRTLKETVIFGVKTNIPYLIKILSHPEFVNGTMSTQFINQHFSKPLVAPELSDAEKYLATLSVKNNQGGTESFGSPFESGWRIV